MQKIFVVRHGQDEDNAAGILNGRRDMELTELGKRQAGETAQKLKSYGIEIIYTSPLKRAYETARIIAEHIGIDEIIVDEHLIEREYGSLTGTRIDEIEKNAKKIFKSHGATYFIEADGAESYAKVLERAKKIMEEITDRQPEKTILIVAHSGIARMLKAVYFQRTWEDELKEPPIQNGGVVQLSPWPRE